MAEEEKRDAVDEKVREVENEREEWQIIEDHTRGKEKLDGMEM